MEETSLTNIGIKYSMYFYTKLLLKLLFFKRRVTMSIVSFLSGATLAGVGFIIWKLKMVEVLAGYRKNATTDVDVLVTVTGLSLILLGALLLVESLLIYKAILIGNASVLTVVGTIIMGIIIVGIITAYFSRH